MIIDTCMVLWNRLRSGTRAHFWSIFLSAGLVGMSLLLTISIFGSQTTTPGISSSAPPSNKIDLTSPATAQTTPEADRKHPTKTATATATVASATETPAMVSSSCTDEKIHQATSSPPGKSAPAIPASTPPLPQNDVEQGAEHNGTATPASENNSTRKGVTINRNGPGAPPIEVELPSLENVPGLGSWANTPTATPTPTQAEQTPVTTNTDRKEHQQKQQEPQKTSSILDQTHCWRNGLAVASNNPTLTHLQPVLPFVMPIALIATLLFYLTIYLAMKRSASSFHPEERACDTCR